MKSIVTKCLEKAAIYGHQSIAFPVLGVGNLGYPVDAVAKGMIEAMIEYTEGNPNSSITDIKIVIFHRDTTAQEVSSDGMNLKYEYGFQLLYRSMTTNFNILLFAFDLYHLPQVKHDIVMKVQAFYTC